MMHTNVENTKIEKVIEGALQKPLSLDITLNKYAEKLPLIIFAHGFKGFKDWGTFNLMADFFARKGFAFLKFNFSHNGTSLQNPTEFDDLESFGNNNFSIELTDLKKVTDWALSHENPVLKNIQTNQVFLMGHSRGGGIAVIYAAGDKRIKKLVTLAAVSDFEKRFKAYDIEKWKKEKVHYVFNARTQQQMPLYYQFYEDFLAHKEKMNILKQAGRLSIPYCIIHGTSDEAVPVSEADNLFVHCHTATLLKIHNANHTFGGKHPWTENHLPETLKYTLDCAASFLENISL